MHLQLSMQSEVVHLPLFSFAIPITIAFLYVEKGGVCRKMEAVEMFACADTEHKYN